MRSVTQSPTNWNWRRYDRVNNEEQSSSVIADLFSLIVRGKDFLQLHIILDIFLPLVAGRMAIMHGVILQFLSRRHGSFAADAVHTIREVDILV